MSAPSAPFAKRLASLLYEVFLVFGVLAVAFALPHIVLAQFLHVVATGPVLWAHVFLVLFAYFGWFWQHGGQTLAMKTWRIRLVGIDDGAVPLWQAILRYLLAWPSLGLCGAGLLWAIVDRDRQFLHDRLAGTRLIRVG